MFVMVGLVIVTYRLAVAWGFARIEFVVCIGFMFSVMICLVCIVGGI